MCRFYSGKQFRLYLCLLFVVIITLPLTASKYNPGETRRLTKRDATSLSHILFLRVSEVDNSETPKLNADPVFSSTPITSIEDNEHLIYEPVVVDADGDEITLQATTLPSWLSLSFKPKETITVAGSYAGRVDGHGTTAAFAQPAGIVIGKDGNVYVAAWRYNRIRRVTPDGRVTTFAGNGIKASTDGQGLNASFSAPTGIDIDASGNLIVVDNGTAQIRKITPEGAVTTLAGSGSHGDVNGTGTDASFNYPQDLAVDNHGNIYLLDTNNNKVKKVTPEGVVTTLAGSGSSGSQDGTGSEATFRLLADIAVDANGNVYVASQNNRVRQITPEGIVTTYAGSGDWGFQDGTGAQVKFSNPMGMDFDKEGNLYLADFSNNRIRKISPAGVVSTYAGTGSEETIDGTDASFDHPNDVALDADGNVYVLDWGSSRLRRISRAKWLLEGDPANQIGSHDVTLTAGDGNGGSATQSFQVSVSDVSAPVLTSALSVSVPENTSGVFYTVQATDSNELTTVTYSLENNGDEALFNFTSNQFSFKTPPDFESPHDANGDNIYVIGLRVSDGQNVQVYQLSVQVTNQLTEGGDSNTAPVFDSQPVTEVREIDNYQYEILVSDPEGDPVEVTVNELPGWMTFDGGQTFSAKTLAGSGTETFRDGTGFGASFRKPNDVDIDSKGNLFVVDETNRVVRKITPLGVVTTFAGSAYQVGLQDGTGSAARFSSPVSLTIDGADNIFVADQGFYNFSTGERTNTSIRKITADGVVTTIAGGPVAAYQDGIGTAAQFEFPIEIELDRFGNLFVLDGPRVRKISPDGTVSTLVGSTYGTAYGTGTDAQFNNANDMVIDSNGNLFLTDPLAIKKVSPQGVLSEYLGGVWGFQDGTGYEAMFNYITSITIDKDDNLFVTDGKNHSIRKITKDRVVSTIFDNENYQYDGPISEAGYSTPVSLKIISNGDFLATELTRDRVMVISPRRFITGAASGNLGESRVVLKATDSKGAETLQSFTVNVLETPVFLSADESAFAENGTGVAYTIEAGFSVSTAALTYDLGSQYDESLFSVNQQTGTVNFLQAPDFENPLNKDKNNHYEIEVIATGGGVTISKMVIVKVTNVSDEAPVFESNPTLRIYEGTDYAYEPRVSDASGEVITVTATTLPAWLSLDDNSQNSVTTFAGSGSQANADGKGTGASFYGPTGLVVDPRNGLIYVTDTGNGRIKKIDQEGNVTSFVGLGNGYDQDGTGSEASFYSPEGLAIDKKGNLYVSSASRVRKVTPEGVVTTIAGNGIYQHLDGTGTNSSFNSARDIAIDSKGNLFVVDTNSNAIRKINPDGVVSTFAGYGGYGYTNGTGLGASFATPIGIAVDAHDNLYVSEFGNPDIRKITPDAVVTTFAGNGTVASVDGTGTNASFSRAQGLVFDKNGNLYVAEQYALRKISASGVVTTIAGSQTAGYADNSNGNLALFDLMKDIAFDNTGSLLIADRSNHRIRRVTFGGKRLSGSSTGQIGIHEVSLKASDSNGDQVSQSFSIEVLDNQSPTFKSVPVTEVDEGEFYNYEVEVEHPQSLAIQVTGVNLPSWLSLADSDVGHVSTAAGIGHFGSRDGVILPNGTDQVAAFRVISDLVTDNEGNIYTTSIQSGLVRKISTNGIVTTLAGNGTGDVNGVGTNAKFNIPAEIVMDENGNLYVADVLNHKIKKISPDGTVSTFVGSGTSGDGIGTGTEASFGFIGGMDIDADGNLYVSNIDKYTISKITPAGIATIYAGEGVNGTVDGTLSTARFYSPRGLAFDDNGNLFVGDRYTIRKISTTGEVTTFAGNSSGGTSDGTGTDASFYLADDLAFDSKGNLYVTDDNSNTLRRVTTGAVVTTVAGSDRGYQDGIGTEAKFKGITSVAIDASDNIYVGDHSQRLRKVEFKTISLKGDTNGHAGDHTITLKVEDTNGKSGEQQYTLTVKDIVSPVFTSATSVNFAENGTGVAYTVMATDSNPLTYALGTGNDEALFNIVNGAVSFKNTPDFETPADANADNDYVIEVQASDGFNMVKQTVTITVTDVEEPPALISLSPIDGSTISARAIVTATFSEDVFGHRGKVRIYRKRDLVVLREMDIVSNEITIDGPQVSFAMPSDLAGGEEVFIHLSPSSLIDSEEYEIGRIFDADTWNLTQEVDTAPTITSLSPVDGGTFIPGDVLTLTLSEAVTKNEGKIRIFKSSNLKVLSKIDVSSNAVAVEGNIIRLTTPTSLSAGEEVFVHFSPKSFKDSGDNDLSGLFSATTWNLTTMADASPTISQLNPVDGGTVNLGSDISVTFSEPVFKRSGKVRFFRASNIALLKQMDIADARISINETVVTITPPGGLPRNEELIVHFAGSTLVDANGNDISGLFTATTWNITIQPDPAPTIVSLNPVDGGNVTRGSTAIVTFSEAVFKNRGKIRLYKKSDLRLLKQMDVSDAQVTVDGAAVSVAMPSDLPIGQEILIHFSPGSFRDATGNDLSGLFDVNTWNLTPVADPAPTISSLSPVDGANTVVQQATFTVIFSENVFKNDGKLRIYRRSDLKVLSTTDISSGSLVVSGSTLSFDLPAGLPEGVEMLVHLGRTALVDDGGNNISGLFTANTWNFTIPGVGPPTTNTDKTSLTEELMPETEASIVLYPNPASKQITINLGGIREPYEALITDVNGLSRFRKEEGTENRLVVSLKDYASGMYILVVQTESGQVLRKKFVVRK